MTESFLIVNKLTNNAVIPTRGTVGSAGYDLYAAHTAKIPAKGKARISLDIAIELPPGHYGQIASRSSIVWNNHVDVVGGIIDEDYRGPVVVILYNHGAVDYDVSKGAKIAQLIITKISTPPIKEVDSLTDTVRGHGGFGSTDSVSLSTTDTEKAGTL